LTLRDQISQRIIGYEIALHFPASNPKAPAALGSPVTFEVRDGRRPGWGEAEGDEREDRRHK